jgi:hypothetical protein
MTSLVVEPPITPIKAVKAVKFGDRPTFAEVYSTLNQAYKDEIASPSPRGQLAVGQ